MIFGSHDDNTLAQFEDVSSRAVKSALMADGHLGYIMPIGGVAAYRNQVSVVGVGFDIACGNCAIKTNLQADKLGDWEFLNEIADEIADKVSFGIGGRNNADDAPVDHSLFVHPSWEGIPEDSREKLRDKARQQLGTVGSGNHYVDVFVDEEGYIWVGVHFGSRGFGHTVASGFLALSQNEPWGKRVPEQEALLDISTPLGQDYWALMQLAGRYAYAGREWVARKVVDILGGKSQDIVHNNHNFAWKENHEGENLIVVRKGATPAFPGQRGFVGGSMGDNSVILKGTFIGHSPIRFAEVRDIQKSALFSTIHGAGRVMSRTEAAGKRNWKTGEIKKPGKLSWEMVVPWLREKGVVLRGGGLDEAPQAYRRLTDVLEAQGDTISVLHELKPIIVVMAGSK